MQHYHILSRRNVVRKETGGRTQLSGASLKTSRLALEELLRAQENMFNG
jgi:hypothetical protein